MHASVCLRLPAHALRPYAVSRVSSVCAVLCGAVPVTKAVPMEPPGWVACTSDLIGDACHGITPYTPPHPGVCVCACVRACVRACVCIIYNMMKYTTVSPPTIPTVDLNGVGQPPRCPHRSTCTPRVWCSVQLHAPYDSKMRVCMCVICRRPDPDAAARRGGEDRGRVFGRHARWALLARRHVSLSLSLSLSLKARYCKLATTFLVLLGSFSPLLTQRPVK